MQQPSQPQELTGRRLCQGVSRKLAWAPAQSLLLAQLQLLALRWHKLLQQAQLRAAAAGQELKAMRVGCHNQRLGAAAQAFAAQAGRVLLAAWGAAFERRAEGVQLPAAQAPGWRHPHWPSSRASGWWQGWAAYPGKTCVNEGENRDKWGSGFRFAQPYPGAGLQAGQATRRITSALSSGCSAHLSARAGLNSRKAAGPCGAAAPVGCGSRQGSNSLTDTAALGRPFCCARP